MLNVAKIFIAFLLGALLVSCARGASNKTANGNQVAGIVGGQIVIDRADPGYQSFVRLEISITVAGLFQISTFCSGVLIDRDLVLTAAHCLKPDLSKLGEIPAIEVEGRAFFPQAENKSVTFSRYVAHGGYNVVTRRTLVAMEAISYNDLAVVRLDDLAPWPARSSLMQRNASVPDGSLLKVRAYGIGMSKNHDMESARVLRSVDLNATVDLVNMRVVFDQSNGQGICHGDSGGPLFSLQDGPAYLVGISNNATRVMLGMDECHADGAAVLLAPYRPWINRVIRELHK